MSAPTWKEIQEHQINQLALETADAEIRRLKAERDELLRRMKSAPVAIMDTRDALSICAPDEESFPALYALQGEMVRLVVEDNDTAGSA